MLDARRKENTKPEESALLSARATQHSAERVRERGGPMQTSPVPHPWAGSGRVLT